MQAFRCFVANPHITPQKQVTKARVLQRPTSTDVADCMRRIMRSTEIPSSVYDVVYGTLLLVTV